MFVCFQIFFLVGITYYLIQTADPIRALAAWENYDISTYGLTDRRSASELPGNIGPSLLTLGPDAGRALKKLAKRMLMATQGRIELTTSRG